MFHQVCIQVAFVARVAVDGIKAGLVESGVVIGTRDVSSDGADTDSLGPELLGQFDDECGLACSDGSHEVDGLDSVALHEAVVLMGDLAVLLEDVVFHPGLDYVHVCACARTILRVPSNLIRCR